MIVAGTALVDALAGSAIAGPLATTSRLSKPEKKQVRKLARGEINKAGLRTSSAFTENQTFIADLGTSFVPVAAATITTHSSGRILATGSAELEGVTSGEDPLCRLQIDGAFSDQYETDPDDIGDNNADIIAVNFAVTRPAGTYTATLECAVLGGTVRKDDAAISVFGLGA
jgi:hypothetical protein